MVLPIAHTVGTLLNACDDWRFKLIKQWPAIIGSLHEHVRLERVEKDVLILGVYDVHWMHELYALSNTIDRKSVV